MTEIKINNHIINDELKNILNLIVKSYNNGKFNSLDRAIGKLETIISIIDLSNNNQKGE